MVLLLQHDCFDFVLFNKFIFLLGNCSIQVLIEQSGLLNRGILAILTVRLIVTNQTVADCEIMENPQGCRTA